MKNNGYNWNIIKYSNFQRGCKILSNYYNGVYDERKRVLKLIDDIFVGYENPNRMEEKASILDWTIDKIKDELKTQIQNLGDEK